MITQFRVSVVRGRYTIRLYQRGDGNWSEWEKLWSRPRATLDGVAGALCLEALGYKPGSEITSFVREDILDCEKAPNFTIPMTRVKDSIARAADARLLVRGKALPTEAESEKKDSNSR